MVLRAVNEVQEHPSIRVINQHVLPNTNVFQFSRINPTEVMRQIDLLYATKCNSGFIPTRTLKAQKEIVCLYLTDYINSTNYDCNFPLFKNL